jgi:thiamine biosynthesis lipoprotein
MANLYSEEKIFMNTNIRISLVSDLGTIDTYNLFDEAFEKFDYVMKKFSRFDPNSELSKLNQAKNKAFHVSEELYFLIEEALKISNLPYSKYDPTITDFLETWGYTKEDKLKNSLDNKDNLYQNLEKKINKRSTKEEIQLHPVNKTITLKEDQKIDLGSIAKGYAVDLATKVILEKLDNFMINAGGDVFCSGMNENQKEWQIGLSIPNDVSKNFGYIKLKDMALTSSGNWNIKYKEFEHILDPNSGKPIKNRVDSCFIYTSKAYKADGLATYLYGAGIKGLNILEDMEIGGLIVSDKKIITNNFFPNFRQN